MKNIKMPNLISKRHGFTLVEMLVVIAIIAILAALLMPALQNTIDAARKLSCLNNLKLNGTAIWMYSESNGGYGLYENTNSPGKISATIELGVLYSYKIIEEPDIFYCPTSSLAPGWTLKTYNYTGGGVQKGLRPIDVFPGATWCSYCVEPQICLTGWQADIWPRKRMVRLKSSTYITSDWFIISSGSLTACPGNHGNDYGNALRVDGAARGFTDFQLMVKGSSSIAGVFSRFTNLE